LPGDTFRGVVASFSSCMLRLWTRGLPTAPFSVIRTLRKIGAGIERWMVLVCTDKPTIGLTAFACRGIAWLNVRLW